jgi:hypothetical protein
MTDLWGLRLQSCELDSSAECRSTLSDWRQRTSLVKHSQQADH